IMDSDLSKLVKNVGKAVELIRALRKENEKLSKQNGFLAEQVRAISTDAAVSAKTMRELERMKVERLKIRDKIGVLLSKLEEVK
ncbi:MAG: cell division protein ZapB, partial [Elusimicrobia bacterium]|nr:cell division protein ZapB [Elusimicrobiota bacterium]